jgi:hypothetical protein
MKTCVNLWKYLIEFFLELEMFQTNVVEKIKTQTFYVHFCFSENRAVYEMAWKRYEVHGG